MNIIKRTLLIFCSALILVGCGGVNNNISFSLNAGSCADGTSNAPYCMAVTIQNNAGGQNYINSTNFPIQNLTFSVSGPNNLNYPLSSGSSMDPNGCVSSNLPPGGTCTFYLQLTGESAPVGPKVPLTINANYTINNTLFGGSNTTASSSFTVYEYPAVVISSTIGSAQRYTNGTSYAAFNAESTSTGAVANAQDNYYGFLYLVGNNNIFASGTESYAYNLTGTASGVSSIVTIGNNVYPIASGNKLYYAQINPLSSLNWASYSYNMVQSINPNVNTVGSGVIYVATNSYVSSCPLNSLSFCNQETSSPANGTILSLGFSTLGAGFTGLVMGTVGGLYVESGNVTTPSSNTWVAVNAAGLTPPVNKIVSDNQQNLYISDSGNNIYLITPNSGNTAVKLTTLNGGTIQSMVYDNAGKVLYVATPNALYGCFYETVNNFSCGSVPVANTVISSALGMNIITSLLPN